MGGEPVRLYVRGQILGYKRSKANQYNHTALIKVRGVGSAAAAWAGVGKLAAGGRPNVGGDVPSYRSCV